MVEKNDADKQARMKQMQEKYAGLQMLERQLKQLQVQIEQFESQIGEIAYVQQGLGDLKNVKIGTEFFVPISSGIFVRAELKDNSFVLVNVGAGAVVQKSIEGATEILEHQAIELRKVEEEQALKMDELSSRAEKVQQELMVLAKEEENV